MLIASAGWTGLNVCATSVASGNSTASAIEYREGLFHQGEVKRCETLVPQDMYLWSFAISAVSSCGQA
jgi:hypothetical protein